MVGDGEDLHDPARFAIEDVEREAPQSNAPDIRLPCNRVPARCMADARHRVLDADDRPVPGLYAAGSTGQGGLLLKGHGHHLAWAFASGRRAGRFAAWEATAPKQA